jgi:hypothetical protein
LSWVRTPSFTPPVFYDYFLILCPKELLKIKILFFLFGFEKNEMDNIDKPTLLAYRAGIVDLATMKKFDKLCMIENHEMKPEDIQHIRVCIDMVLKYSL